MQRFSLAARVVRRAPVLFGGLSILLSLPAVRAAEGTFSRSRENDAPTLVQAALDAELANDPAKRAKLLEDAIAADPNFAPARWLSGQVKFDGQWRKLDVVQNLVANHPRWVGYRKLRASLGTSLEDHVQLGEYCRVNNLAIEGRYHWANVLMADPENEAARSFLGLEEFRGELLTHEQVAELKDAAKNADANFKRHRLQLTKLCRNATLAHPIRRATALAEISVLADSSAMAPLEQIAEKACEKAPKYAEGLHLAVVAALANMPEHEATLRLLNHAVYADSQAVSAAAARALLPRAQTDYMPLLMAALRAPIEVDFDILATPDGSVRLAEVVRQAGPTSQAAHVRRTNRVTEGVFNHDPNRSNPAQVLAGHLNQAANQLAKTKADVDAANAEAATLNERIVSVLRIATGSDLSEDAQTWWAHWQAENELQMSGEEALISSYEESSFVYFYPEAPTRYSDGTPVGLVEPEPVCSCFVPGTPVWTPAGAAAIEHIVPGDLVLAQNPHTGELDYRAVLAVTLGSPAPVIDIHLRKETIGATRGHRFWVPGEGWEMAKQLGPAARLLALGGSVDVESVAEGAPVACHNLVVEEFHTYFVGDGKMLVHDITCPEPERATIPGSRVKRPLAAPPPLAQQGAVR
jgi:hypothetical protein